MYKRILVFTLAMMCLSATALWAQHGAWEGCTLKNMKARYTDQQIGGYLLHESATLVREAYQAISKIHTPQQRRLLARILTKASENMEHISLIMKRGNLSQKDINNFQREIESAKRKIREILRQPK